MTQPILNASTTTPISDAAPLTESAKLHTTDWLLMAGVLAFGVYLCYSRWSGARTARRLTAAADAYASLQLTRLNGDADSSAARTRRRIASNSPAPHFLENVSCSS